jgi:hypothetical protein
VGEREGGRGRNRPKEPNSNYNRFCNGAPANLPHGAGPPHPVLEQHLHDRPDRQQPRHLRRCPALSTRPPTRPGGPVRLCAPSAAGHPPPVLGARPTRPAKVVVLILAAACALHLAAALAGFAANREPTATTTTAAALGNCRRPPSRSLSVCGRDWRSAPLLPAKDKRRLSRRLFRLSRRNPAPLWIGSPAVAAPRLVHLKASRRR